LIYKRAKIGLFAQTGIVMPGKEKELFLAAGGPVSRNPGQNTENEQKKRTGYILM
jgi:hypothetical protein